MLFDYSTESGLIRAYGVIGFEFDETDIMRALDAMGGRDITLQIQSPGGDAIAGISIYQQLANYPGNVVINIDTLAASAATIIMMAGNQINASEIVRVMIHQAHTIEIGNADDFENTAALLRGFDQDIANTYAKRANGDADFWLGLMQKETWFNADEAIEHGLVDGVMETAPVGNSEASEATATAENVLEQKPVYAMGGLSKLGPAGQTMVQAMKMRKRLLDNGTLKRKTS